MFILALIIETTINLKHEKWVTNTVLPKVFVHLNHSFWNTNSPAFLCSEQICTSLCFACMSEKKFASGLKLHWSMKWAGMQNLSPQVQTRSADEPMTTFVLCNECGNRWKVRISLHTWLYKSHRLMCNLACWRPWNFHIHYMTVLQLWYNVATQWQYLLTVGKLAKKSVPA